MSAGTGPVVVLIGPPGAGKTTVAGLLAEQLGVGVRDTDADVEATQGRTVPEIFVDAGEEAFRAAEEQAVAVALAEHRGVLALGGGAVLSPTTRQRLAGHPVVFLDVGLSHAVRRVGMSASRPLLLGNVRSRLKQLLDARRPLYAEVAAHRVLTDDRSAAEVAAAVLAVIEDREHSGSQETT